MKTVSLIAGSFGGVNLEDISAPRCFEIERKLKECCDIPVFHDDQHGTAVVVAAAAINALKIAGKKMEEIKIVVNGAGSAGIAISKQLLALHAQNLILVDKFGILCEGMKELNSEQKIMAERTNKDHLKGTLADAMKGADLFIGVSAPGCVSSEMVRSMNQNPVLFPMANPTPEIMPDEALKAGATVVGTGRSDFPNQINNVLAFPGIFRGALDVRASDINEEMKTAAAKAIAGYLPENELRADNIIPSALDRGVATAVAKAVAKAASDTGIARMFQ